VKLLKLFGIRTEKDIVLNLLQSHGIGGDDMVAGVQRLIQAANAQHEVIMQAQVALRASDEALAKMSSGEADKSGKPDDVTHSYFIGYDASYSICGKAHADRPPTAEEANDILNSGGGPMRANGMTVVNIEGGIKNWQNVVGIAHFICKSTFANQSNVHVVIRNIVEINRWKGKK
jgi:hypothetical protein